MDLKEALLKSMAEVCSLYGMEPQFQQDTEGSLLATDQVNVMISFGPNPKGKITFGFNRARALKIATAMLGEEAESLDLKTGNILSEFATFITGLAIGKTAVIGAISFSAPIIITGTNVHAVISRLKVKQLVFQIDDDLLLLTYCIE